MVKKTFNEKLQDSKDMPKIIEIQNPKVIDRYKGNKMLIAPPLAYDEIIRKIPVGKVTTNEHIRKYLAKKHGAEFTCPLTAGIFINIAARASEERGKDETPYWRVLKNNGELNEKYPFGTQGQKEHLTAEGFSVVQKGQRYFIENYLEKMYELV